MLLISIVVAVWLGTCLLIVAVCASAKRGDGEDATLVPEAVLRPRRRRIPRRVRRRAPALS